MAYQDGIIKTIPDGTIYHKEVIIDYENCWLKNGQEYLEVNGTRYSSMTAAYEDVEDGGTIYVVDSIVSEAALPEFKKNKNITLDLNGNSITYLQPLINTNGSLTIIDSKGNGSLNNTNASNPTIRNNGGSLIIDSGIINGIYRAIHMHGGSLTVNGGTIKSESNTTGNVAIYVDNGINVIINNGNIISKTNSPEGNPNGNSGRETTVIYLSSNNNNITVNGGNLTSGGSSLGGVRRIIYGVSASLGNTITINDGELNATHEIINEIANASYPTTYFIQGYTLGSAANTTYVKGGKINIFSKNVAYGFGNVTSGDNNANIISGGEITITAGTGYGIVNGRNTISGGTIRINAENKGYGINGGTNTINNGQIIIQLENGTGYGINGGTNTINNGQIIIQSENGTGYGINGGTNNISGGRIESSTYGIYNGTTTLGNNDGEINIENPEIIGDSYGVYGGTMNFYDGILKGQIVAYTDKIIYNIATSSKIKEEVKEINEKNYYVDYLVPQTGVIQINGDVNKEYNDLNSAILNSEPGDRLVLVDNILNTDPITIPSDKEVIIDVSDYSITSSKPIINNGNVSIINNSSNERILSYYGTDYLITNNNGAILTLDNINLDSQYVIKNNAGGIFNGNSVNITSTNTAINNLGKMSINNFDITGTTYGIYNSSNEENSISNSTITSTNNPIYNNSTSITSCNNVIISGLVTNNNVNGTLNFKDSEITNTLTSALEIINKGNMTLDNTNVNGSYNKAIQNDGILSINNGSIISVESETSRPENATGISNSKSLSINNSTINVNIPNSSNIFTYTLYGIYNTKDVTMDNTSITVDSNDKFNHYGMYTENGNVLMSSGSIKVKGLTSYGIYLKSGSVTLGVPEVYGSSTYGRENADVSISSPLIESLGTTNSIGIKNDSQGLTYYDGKIVARNTPLPENPNKVEYMFEPKEYIDEDTGYKYVILKWMRTQGGN